jgi:tellurite resistance protein TehA-like permease
MAREAASSLFPGYFAMVMATGVIAIQANKLGFAGAAKTLVIVGAITYLILWALTIARIAVFGRKIVSDFRSFAKGPAFFTTSAATTVLAKALLLILNQTLLAQALWIFAWCIWGFLMYAFALNLFTSADKPSLQQSISGVWLIIPVATQSLSILTGMLSPFFPNHALLMLVSLSLYMLGCALYLIVIAAVIYRLAFSPLEPQDLKPAYWVCMGAAAISTLAGVELCKRVDIWPLPFEPLPALQGFAMFFWVVATAWIPLLMGLGLWRHIVRKVPFVYEPQYWSMIFPLAMYAICTGGISEIFRLTALGSISLTFLCIAAAGWSLALIGLLKGIVIYAVPARSQAAPETQQGIVQ